MHFLFLVFRIAVSLACGKLRLLKDVVFACNFCSAEQQSSVLIPAIHTLAVDYVLLTENIGRTEGRDRGGRSAHRALHRGFMDLQGVWVQVLGNPHLLGRPSVHLPPRTAVGEFDTELGVCNFLRRTGDF